MAIIAALYVQERGTGAYVGLPDVDPWGITRDARRYAGPYPVVAHPPCERWGRYSTGGPSHHGKFKTGDDGGCFEAALAAVRRFGGVLEHPAGSKAWAAYGLSTHPRAGGWVNADEFGYTAAVDQGFYGHRAAKATWLYAAVPDPTALPGLRWGASGIQLEPTEKERARGRRSGVIERMSKLQREVTPPEFRDLLLSIARLSSR